MDKEKLRPYAPVGMNLNTEFWVFILGLIFSTLFSLFFFADFDNAYDRLFRHEGDRKILRPDAVMPDFDVLALQYFVGFGILALIMLLFIFFHYGYHHQETKSIYLMRRLSDPWELHRRCLTLPLLGAGATLLVAFVLLLLFFAVYMAVTPEECLTPCQWQKIWR